MSDKKCTDCGGEKYIIASQDGIEVCYDCYHLTLEKRLKEMRDKINEKRDH